MTASLPADRFGSAAAVRLSIVVVNDFGWVNGGQSAVAIESALDLHALGHDVCFVAGRGPLDTRLINSGIECRIVGSHDILSDPSRARAAFAGIWNFAAARVVEACVAARDPDFTIIHVHGWAKALSPSIGPVVTRSAAAHVYTLHEYFLACPNGGFYDYGSGEICGRRALSFDCLTTQCDSRGPHHKIWRVARQAILWSAGRMPRGLRELIYLTPEQRDIMRPYVPAKARWHYLPNAAGARPSRRTVAEDNRTFLFVGRLSPEKGAVVAARAAAMAGLPIAFCGDGDEREAVLEANPDAQMLGWLPKEALAAVMADSRCLLFPSLWYETYGLVVADALRIGLPVLVSDTCVAASMVEDGVNGYRVSTGMVEDWASTMGALSSDDLVHALSVGAFRSGAKLLGREEYIARLIDIYACAIAAKRQRALASEELVS